MKVPAEWPAFNIERRRIGDLLRYANNARTHGDGRSFNEVSEIRISSAA
jgi:hypothetical protein